MLAVGAIVAAAATADATRPYLVFSGSPPPTSEEVSLKLQSGAHARFYDASMLIVECTVARGRGELLNSASIARLDKVEITYEECSAPSYSSCTINGSKSGSLKTSSTIEGEFGYEPPAVTTKVLVNLVPSSGTFTEVTFGSNCPLGAGTYQIKKGVIAEIPNSDVNTSSPIASFPLDLGLTGSFAQLFKEIEVVSLTSTLDELKIGSLSGALSGNLEVTLLSGKVTIKTV